MAESDTEDDKFVKNVIHELSAFQKTDENSGTTDQTEGGRGGVGESDNVVQEPKEPSVPSESLNESAKVGEVVSKKEAANTSTEPSSDPPKPPSRIIRLSRPYNPSNSTRTSISSVTPSSSVSSSLSSVPQNGAPTTTTTSMGTAAPGSRLAAMQRPGSPMQRILARAQSPALAAAARMTRQASADSTKMTPGSNGSLTKEDTTVDQSQKSNDKTTPETKPGNNSGQASSEEGATAQSRAVVPPKIHSSGLTGSVLLRRPQSPLNTGRTSQLLIHKQVSSTGAESPSPRSPRSDAPLSPKEANSSETNEESLPADKVAIRNKLRANSFRLKDLLTKRPFVRSQESSSGENSVNSAEQNTNDPSANIDKAESETSDNLNSGVGTDRTRWRRQGLSNISRSKSTVSERTATLISSRHLRRNRNSTEASNESDKASTVSDDTKLSEITDLPSSEPLTSDTSATNGREPEKGYRPIDRVSEVDNLTDNMNDAADVGSGRMTIGATLLRSPRTRSASGSSNVPSSPEKSSQQKTFDQLGNNQVHSESNSDDKSIQNDNADKKTKAISELEKESDVNLVFDSEKLGKSESSPEEPVQNDRNYNMSQSEYVMSHSKKDEKHRMRSEPTSPDKVLLVPSMKPSQSYDNTAELDFSRSSPALKRSLAVTDLDQAMKDRDKQKLSSIFKDGVDKDNEGTGIRSRLHSSEDKTEVLKQSESQLETDLDARLLPTHRIITRSPHIRQKTQSCQETPISPPHSAPPVNPVAPMVYKPHINLEDAIKWPMEIPGKLDFRKMEVFEGQMLLNWLSGSIDKSHYLRLVMTKHDINVIACQVCTCLIAAGVMKQLESKDQENVFKTDCMYYWTHTQHNSPNINQDVNKLQPMWPPTQEQTEDNRPGLKYTEADHQAAMVTLRHEYKEEVDTIQREHQGVLDKARQEYENRLQQAIERIALLSKEVEKYKCLAGIEKLTQNALSVADAAQLEAGLQPDMNGFSTPMSNTPSVSQYCTPAGTPEGFNVANNVVKSSNELYAESIAPSDGTSCSGSETASLAGSVGDSVEGGPTVAPPPAPPPPPGMPFLPGMPPPPPPMPGMMEPKKASKPVVNPKSAMKPLFWNRIQVNEIKHQKHSDFYDRRLLWEEVEEEKIDVTELDQLFSKRNVEPSRRFFNKPKNKAKEAAKVITPKRSQVIGILLSSLRLDMSDIEHAILTFDTSQLGEEKLRQIYENRADNDEMKKVKEHVRKHPDIPLDKPDQFLYDLSLIPDYAERIFCFIFREAFQESISVIETKMTNLRMTCQILMSSIHVKRILGMVLALGNYMNGGSKSRGQADGFGIDILPKLKDVKSKDNATSLLHYTVQQYIKKFEHQDAGTDKVKFPLPDPSDLTQGCQVCFDELDKELRRIKKDFEAAEERAAKVINTARELVYLQPFKDIMMEFFEKGKQEFIEQEENLADGKRLFQETVIFFCVKPKSGDKVVTPEYFFSLWCSFCQDFKDIWKREQQKIVKLRIKENEIKVKQMQQRLAKKPVRTRTRKAGGLKDRLTKQGLLES